MLFDLVNLSEKGGTFVLDVVLTDELIDSGDNFL